MGAVSSVGRTACTRRLLYQARTRCPNAVVLNENSWRGVCGMGTSSLRNVPKGTPSPAIPESVRSFCGNIMFRSSVSKSALLLHYSTSSTPGSGAPATPHAPPGSGAPATPHAPSGSATSVSGAPATPHAPSGSSTSGSGAPATPQAPSGSGALPVPPVRQRRWNWRPDFHTPVTDRAKFAKMFAGFTEDGGYSSLSAFYLMCDPVEYVRRNQMFQLREIPNSTTWWRWIFTDYAKHLERSLILILVAYHKMDLCFTNLTIDDLYICADGTFKVRSYTPIQKLTPDGVDKDYANAAKILLHLMTESMGASLNWIMPGDQKRLLQLMKEDASQHEYLVATNVAMLPMATRSVALRKFHGEVFRIIPDGPERSRILRGLDQTHWINIANRNSYLRGCIAYRNQFKPYQQHDKQDFVEMNRNFEGHQYDRNNSTLADGDCELIQYAHYPMLLSELQEGLWKNNRLGHLYIEELFTDGNAPLLDSLRRDPPPSPSGHI